MLSKENSSLHITYLIIIFLFPVPLYSKNKRKAWSKLAFSKLILLVWFGNFCWLKDAAVLKLL